MPAIVTVHRGPMRGAANPANKLPAGNMPTAIMEYNDMTRPRKRSSIEVCTSVLTAAFWRKMLNPVTAIAASSK